MKRIVLTLILIFICLNEVQAAKGIVVYNRAGCSYFIVETLMGYALLQWFGGSLPLEGDAVAGDFETFGLKDIYDITRDTTIKVWVDNFWLSKSSVIEKYYEKCPK